MAEVLKWTCILATLLLYCLVLSSELAVLCPPFRGISVLPYKDKIALLGTSEKSSVPRSVTRRDGVWNRKPHF